MSADTIDSTTTVQVVGNETEQNKMRASDADRESVAKVLHNAMSEGRLTVSELDERLADVYAAKTLGELVPLTADLPTPSPVHAVQHQPAPNALSSPRIDTTARPVSPVGIGVLSGFERKGEWVVPQSYTAIAVLGSCELDYTNAVFNAADTVVNCTAILGSVDIKIPEDVNVHVEGFGVLGDFRSNVENNPGPGHPTVLLRGFALLGSVEVTRPKRKKNKKLES